MFQISHLFLTFFETLWFIGLSTAQKSNSLSITLAQTGLMFALQNKMVGQVRHANDAQHNYCAIDQSYVALTVHALVLAEDCVPTGSHRADLTTVISQHDSATSSSLLLSLKRSVLPQMQI